MIGVGSTFIFVVGYLGAISSATAVLISAFSIVKYTGSGFPSILSPTGPIFTDPWDVVSLFWP